MSTAHSSLFKPSRLARSCADRETLLATIFLVALLIGQASAATGHAPLVGPAVNGVRHPSSRANSARAKTDCGARSRARSPWPNAEIQGHSSKHPGAGDRRSGSTSGRGPIRSQRRAARPPCLMRSFAMDRPTWIILRVIVWPSDRIDRTRRLCRAPAQPALNAVDPDRAAVTNAAPANGYDFLERAGYSRRHIGAVLERAATLGTTPRRVLFHEGHITPERYTAALARDAAPGSPGASAMYRAAPSASTLLDRASKRRARRSHGHGRRGTRCALR